MRALQFDSSRLRERTRTYTGTLTTGMHEIPVTLVETAELTDTELIVQTKLSAKDTKSVDTVWFERDTLQVRRQRSEQEAVRLEVDYDDHEVSGTISVRGQKQAFKLESVGPQLIVGGAANFILSVLELQLGDQLEFVQLNGQELRYEPAMLLVDEERILKGERYIRIRIQSASGNAAYWRQCAPPYDVIKYISELPRFGSASISLELESTT